MSASTRRGLLVLGGFLAISMLYWGRFALTGRGTIGVGPDVQIFIWGLRWWPYAVLHGIDPFVARVVWAPSGSDVLWTTTVPGLSLLMAPVTLLLGAAVSWNALCVLAPAVSAFAAYLLCREATGREWPSTVGGLIFGFSSYQIAEGLAHLQMTMTACLPLAAWVILRHLHGRLGPRGLAARLAAITVIQFLISPEILATMLLVGCGLAAGALVLVPDRRAEIRRLTTCAGAGVAAALILLAPVLAVMLGSRPAHSNGAVGYPLDPLNLVLPTRATALGGDWASRLTHLFPGNLSEQTGYLGLPLIAIVVAFAARGARRARDRWLLAVLAGTVVLSLGRRLTVLGHHTVWLPGAILARLPVLGDALPSRFALYTALIVSLIVALWLARPRPRPWVAGTLAVAAVIALAPTPSQRMWWRPTPTAIASGWLNRQVPAGSNVISLPFWNVTDRGLYAQAADDMRFRLVDSWLQLMPDNYRRLSRLAGHLSARGLANLRGHAQVERFRRVLCENGIDYAVAWNQSRDLLAALGISGVRSGSAVVYRLPPCAQRRPPSRAAPMAAAWPALQ